MPQDAESPHIGPVAGPLRQLLRDLDELIPRPGFVQALRDLDTRLFKHCSVHEEPFRQLVHRDAVEAALPHGLNQSGGNDALLVLWSQIPFEHQQAALRGKCRGAYVHPECVWWLARRKGRGELLVVFVEGERIALHCDGWVGLRVLLQQRVHRRLQGWVCGHPEPKGDLLLC